MAATSGSKPHHRAAYVPGYICRGEGGEGSGRTVFTSSAGHINIRCWGIAVGGQAVVDAKGDWIDPLDEEDAPPGSSDRAFGLIFAVACGVVAASALWGGRRSAL